MKKIGIALVLVVLTPLPGRGQERKRARDWGIVVGVMPTGVHNAITDVSGVRVGHKTIVAGEDVRTGVTVVLPHQGNLFQQKVPAAIVCFNAFGKLAGSTQVEELGNLETPIALTNTLAVGTAVRALVEHTLEQARNENVRSVNAVVGETNDGTLNHIRGLHVTEQDVLDAIGSARPGPVEEGAVGAGTGTRAFGYKGGIGTASRLTPPLDGKAYTVGVLVQTNFGDELSILGVPVSRIMKREAGAQTQTSGDGSCMIVIATDAPMSERTLRRMARRAFIAMGRTTSVMSNGSGDFAIAFSTAYHIPHESPRSTIAVPPLLSNDATTVFFRAVEEATEEAIYNSLFMARTTRGFEGNVAEQLPTEAVLAILRRHQALTRSGE